MRTHRARNTLASMTLAATALALVCAARQARAAAPTTPALYANAFRQSPVRAEPGDLLMIAGSGFASGDRVAYQRVANTTIVPGHPASIPSPNTANSGEAAVVLSAPDAITIQLPSVMTPNESYVFWVKNSANRWSGGTLINDARPLWISPERVFVSQSLAGLPRRLKVIGRNLEATAGGTTLIRLTKSQRPKATYVLSAESDGMASTAIERYAAIATLPPTMTAGTYSVEVNRDGASWVALAGQSFVVSPDPPSPQVFPVGGPCAPDDGQDDTTCVATAIAAAAAGGGVVSFGAGTWDLGASGTPAPDKNHGLLVPTNVSLSGAGSAVTTILRGAHWDAPPVFTLLGSNEVKNINFKDSVFHVLGDETHRERTFLQLGRTSSSTSWGDRTVVDTVVIHGNVFDNAIACIREGGFPIAHLYIVDNEFGGWAFGILFDGPGSTETNRARFSVLDSVISGNTFKPGGYVDPTGAQGPIASEIGASYHLDFSDNVADGTATDYLNGAPPGFRAAFFFHMANNHEMMLVSRNRGSCTGDRAGDGEFVCYDNNQNNFGFTAAVNVQSATATSVTVSGALQVPSPADYYAAHWIQVVAGSGIGQARKITSYAIGSGTVKFNVSPAWDVPPSASSRITVAREVWQALVVDNTVDNSACALAPGHPDYVWRPESGEISLWATMADSVVEGNAQTGTDGIFVQSNYSIPPDSVDQNLKQFVEIRGNTISGEVNYDAYCSWSGIVVNYGSSKNAPSPVLGYGVSIGRNTVSGADGLRGGAIVVEDGAYWPQAGYPVWVNLLIHNNAIQDLGNDPPGDIGPKPDGNYCDFGAYPHRRGIHLHAYSPDRGYAIARTVLTGNTYPPDLVCRFLDVGTTGPVNLDAPPVGGWCPTP